MDILIPETEIPAHLKEFFEPVQAGLLSVLAVNTNKRAGQHYAPFAENLITPCVLATCPEEGVVLDCFCGSGTTGVVALKNKRHFIGIELAAKSVELARQKCQAVSDRDRM